MNSRQNSGAKQRTQQPGRSERIRTAAERLLDLIYPQNLYCLCCEDTMQQNRIHGICDNCAEKIEWLTHNPLRSRMDEFAFDELYSCCVYGFYARKIIHALKLHNKTYIARNIGLLMAEKLQLETGRSLGDAAVQNICLNTGADTIRAGRGNAALNVCTGRSDAAQNACHSGSNAALNACRPGAAAENTGAEQYIRKNYAALIPVPSSPKKLKQRGYNQAELLARYAGKKLGLSVWSDVLFKTAETASMRLSSGIDRRNMLQGAFSVSENACEKLREKDIILVDDVVTTGSTADACAMALKDAGAKSVTVLCFASAAHAFNDSDLTKSDEDLPDAQIS